MTTMPTLTPPEPAVDPHAAIDLDALPLRAQRAARVLMFPLTTFSRADLSTRAVRTLRGMPNCSEQTIKALRACLAEAGLSFADEKHRRPRPPQVTCVAVCPDAADKKARALRVRVVQNRYGVCLQPLGPDGNPLFVARVEYHAGRITAGVTRADVDQPVITLSAEEIFRGTENQPVEEEGAAV